MTTSWPNCKVEQRRAADDIAHLIGTVGAEQVFGEERPSAMRVLGVDPGLTRCGLGVVEGAPGRTMTLLDVDVIRTSAEFSLGRRLQIIDQAINQWIVENDVDTVVVERVFSQHNVRTVMGTAQASGVAVLAAARHGLSPALRTPSEVKAAVTGSGRADKTQVQTMVQRLLRLPERPRPADAADALALAICQVWRGGTENRWQEAIAAQVTR